MDEHGTPLTSEADRTAGVDTTTSGPRRARLLDALTSVLGGPQIRQRGHLVVDHWDGVQIVGDHARVRLRTQRLHPGCCRFAAARRRRQHQPLLTRLHGDRLVTRERAASGNQG